jgi:hypothetical protein
MTDTRISDLPEATTLDGTELALLSQGGTDAKAALSRLRDELDWARPADWPAMPATEANAIHILAAVHDHASNFAALRCSTSSGTWSIDWGDGTSTTGIASNTSAEHTYDFADGDLPSLTSRGYKIAIVTITADSGDLTVFNSAVTPTGTSAHTPPWLEMQINGSAITSLSFTNARMCEYINIVATGAVPSIFFDNLTRLQKLDFHSTFLSTATSLFSAFINCIALKRIDLVGLNPSLTSLQSTFQNCTSLASVTFPAGSLGASLTTMQNCFLGCVSLPTITFPSGSLTGLSNALTAFGSMNALREIVFPSGSLAALTNASTMFSGCTSLRYAEFPSGALAAVTNIASMFNGCATLQTIKFPPGAFASLSSATTSTFNACTALSRIENCGIPLTFSLANCRLGAAALDEIYAALPTISSQTITVTGNYGASADTPSIATGKGWTVTG